nr:hypothetical protein [Tanacetum cinerariifolium]
MDRAILDGMDVLSMSLGGGSGHYYKDIIAIGAFKAMEMGVFVSCSARNSNGKKVNGVSLYSGKGMGKQMVELVYFSGKVVFCDRGVNPRVEKGQVVKEAGGVGMLLGNTAESGEELVTDSHLLPVVAV